MSSSLKLKGLVSTFTRREYLVIIML